MLMVGYSFGLQRIFLLKNIVCGMLAMSPLIGGSAVAVAPGNVSNVGTGISMGIGMTKQLWQLSWVGLALQVSREILKDVEDVEMDRGKKLTLPLVVGRKVAHRVAYGITFGAIGVMVFTKTYWQMFSCRFPIYPIGVMIGMLMCVRASAMPVRQGETLLKKSIFVLLFAMITSSVMR